jgi:hypothetical protein
MSAALPHCSPSARARSRMSGGGNASGARLVLTRVGSRPRMGCSDLRIADPDARFRGAFHGWTQWACRRCPRGRLPGSSYPPLRTGSCSGGHPPSLRANALASIACARSSPAVAEGIREGVAPSIWPALSVNTVKSEMIRRPRWARGLQARLVHVPAKRASREFMAVFAGYGFGVEKMRQHGNLQRFPCEARQ